MFWKVTEGYGRVRKDTEDDGRERKMVHSLSQLKKDMEAHRTLGYTALVRHGILQNVGESEAVPTKGV